MLNRENNEILTRTGPDTPMGKLMRCFWTPAMTEAELPGPDEPPMRLQLLGEALVVFRDTEGHVGVFDQHCPHRGASLFFGRNEEGGLRCVYHGWKFGVDGKCLDMPTEASDSPMRCKVVARAYKTQITGGVLWVYMGDPAEVAHFKNDPVGAMQAIAKEPGRENIEAVSADLVAMPEVTQPADVLWLHLFYHDLHTALMQARGATAADFNRAVYARLKSGGSYVIVDHVAAAGTGTSDTQSLHRIDPASVRTEVEAAGFVLDAEVTMLANKDDPRSAKAFDASIKGKTDRFAYRFVKR